MLESEPVRNMTSITRHCRGGDQKGFARVASLNFLSPSAAEKLTAAAGTYYKPLGFFFLIEVPVGAADICHEGSTINTLDISNINLNQHPRSLSLPNIT